MRILFAYDGSTEADAAIARAATLFGHRDTEAVVLSVWEPLTVQALRAERFGSPMLGVPYDAVDQDENSAHQAQHLAEHGARLAGEAGFEARALSVADDRKIAETIAAGADELDADVIVLGARGLAGIAALLGSVSTAVAQHAGRPVLIVPHAADRAALEPADAVAAAG